MRPARFVLLVALLGAAAWFGLDSLRPRSDWVTLDCPPFAIPGRPFPLHLRLAPPLPTGRLGADLHRRDGATGRSTVAGVFQTNLNPSQTDYQVEIPVRAGSTSGTARIVVYLSPNGSWKDRSHAAITDDIALLAPNPTSPPVASQLARRNVFNLGGPSLVTRFRSVPVRVSTSVLWLGTAAAGLGLARVFRSRAAQNSVASAPRMWSFAMACLVAGLAEATDVSRALGEGARVLARRFAAYDGREPGQQVISALAVALSFAVVVALLRRPRPISLRLSRAAVALTLGLVCLDALSLHAFDEIAESMPFGIPLIQMGTLACALTAAVSVGLAWIGLRGTDRVGDGQTRDR